MSFNYYFASQKQGNKKNIINFLIRYKKFIYQELINPMINDTTATPIIIFVLSREGLSIS